MRQVFNAYVSNSAYFFLNFQQYNCPKIKTPSSNDTVCQKFHDDYVKHHKSEFPPRYEVEIKISGEENKTHQCFDNTAYHHGNLWGS